MTATLETTGTGSILGSAAEVFVGRYRVKIKIRNRICGGVPKDPDVQIKWLERAGFNAKEAEEHVRLKRAEAGDAEEFIAEETEKTWSGFRSDARGLYLESRQVKACLRECATELKITTQKRGFRQRLQHGTVVRPDRLYLGRTAPDGFDMAVVHAITPRGKIAAFSRFDFAREPEIEFEVWIVQAEMFTREDLRRMLILAQEMGLGARRSQGEGKFDVIEFEAL